MDKSVYIKNKKDRNEEFVEPGSNVSFCSMIQFDQVRKKEFKEAYMNYETFVLKIYFCLA